MERTITLIWDEAANGWRDKHSRKKIAVIPPEMTLEPIDVPSQPNDDAHLIALVNSIIDQRAGRLDNLVDAVRDDWLPRLLDRKIEERIAATNMYFVDRDKLVTAGYMHEITGGLSNDVRTLEWRLHKLEQPWYKRWFS